MSAAPAENAARRLRPRLTDTDWLLLRLLRPAIEAFADRTITAGVVAIDLGCGSQPYRSIIESRGGTYIGADFDGGAITIDPTGRIDASDASADVVLSFQVLEHVRDIGAYLGEAHRIVRSDGRLILSTHGSWFYHPHPEDHRRWTRQGLASELLAHGFETLECSSLLGPLAFTTLLRLTIGFHACRKIPLVGRALARLLAIAMNARGCLESMITPAWITRDNACVYVALCRPVA